jgi:periplasmic divalent cation tolerance protein
MAPGNRQSVNHRVENKLAARVNILPKMDSIYVWDGQLRNGTEHKIFIKTCAAQLAALQSDIKSSHHLRCGRDIAF